MQHTYRIVLVGNKSDLKNIREVTYKEAKQLANSKNNITDYYELSVKETPSLIDSLFRREAKNVSTHINTFLSNTVGIVDQRKNREDSNIYLKKINNFSSCSKC